MSAELVRDIRYRNKPQAGLAQLISALRMPLQRGQSHHVDPPPAAGSSLLGNLESPLTALVQNVSEGKKRKANTLFWIAALKRLFFPPRFQSCEYKYNSWIQFCQLLERLDRSPWHGISHSRARPSCKCKKMCCLAWQKEPATTKTPKPLPSYCMSVQHKQKYSV